MRGKSAENKALLIRVIAGGTREVERRRCRKVVLREEKWSAGETAGDELRREKVTIQNKKGMWKILEGYCIELVKLVEIQRQILCKGDE